MGKKTLMSRAAASRIQSSTAKRTDGGVEKGTFAARAQSAAYKNFPIDNNPHPQGPNASTSLVVAPSPSPWAYFFKVTGGLSLAVAVLWFFLRRR